jgi:hypothetical protein
MGWANTGSWATFCQSTLSGSLSSGLDGRGWQRTHVLKVLLLQNSKQKPLHLVIVVGHGDWWLDSALVGPASQADLQEEIGFEVEGSEGEAAAQYELNEIEASGN